MATAFLHRLLVVVPAARVGPLNIWIKANLDPTGDNWLTIGLSVSGNAPATHSWACAAFTNAQLKAFLARMCNLAGLAQPADWDTRNRAQKLQWVRDQRAAIRTSTGIWLVPMDNDGVWDSPADALTFLGLKRIESVAP